MASSKKIRVRLWGAVKRFAVIDSEATKGAVIGRNLLWDDGTIVERTEIINTTTPTEPSTGITTVFWSLIVGIPAFIKSLADLTGTGLVARISAGGDAAVRAIQAQDDRILVTDGDGVAGDPVIGMTDWPRIKANVGAGETFNLPANFQSFVWQGLTVDGTVNIDGELITLDDDQDTGMVRTYIWPGENYIIPELHQLVVDGAYEIDGDMDVEGELLVDQDSGSGTGWPQVRNTLLSAESLLVKVDHQLIVADAFNSDGNLSIEGNLVVI